MGKFLLIPISLRKLRQKEVKGLDKINKLINSKSQAFLAWKIMFKFLHTMAVNFLVPVSV